METTKKYEVRMDDNELLFGKRSKKLSDRG